MSAIFPYFGKENSKLFSVDFPVRIPSVQSQFGNNQKASIVTAQTKDFVDSIL